jgi:Predicted metal-dependent phosphoesterases (PHP family)
MRELAELGLAGMECIYGRFSPEEREGLAGMARRLGLVATGGSDHHGTYKPDLSVGVGQGDLDVPESALEELAARRPS